MDKQDEGTRAGSSVSIDLKACPRCKTPIRTAPRYGNVVRERLRDIEEVKRIIRGDPAAVNRERDDLRSKLRKTKLGDERLSQRFERRLMGAGDIPALTDVENRLNLAATRFNLKRSLVEWPLRKVSRQVEVKCDFLLSELRSLGKRATGGTCNEKGFCQISVEFTRLSLYIELHKVQTEAKVSSVTLSERQDILDAIEKELLGGSCIPEERLDQHLKEVAEIR